MGILNSLSSVIGGGSGFSAVKVGACRGRFGGNLGVFATWGKQNHEVFRVRVKYQGVSHAGKALLGEFSYTFQPAHDQPFYESIETPRLFKEFIAGRSRAEQGTVVLEFVTSGNITVTQSYDLEFITKCYRGKGPKAPVEVVLVRGLEEDKPEVAAIKNADLKAFSEKIKLELEQKRLKEEAERKAKEEAAKKAAEDAAKAAAAKAAAPKAAAAGGVEVDRSKPTLPKGRVLMVYGSSTGNTKNVAEALQTELGGAVDQVKSITDIHPVDLTQFEKLILGIPTWHIGEMQDDWAACAPEIAALDFTGKKVAVFGLGDGKGYADTYVDAMDELFTKFKGATLVGQWPTDGYDFKKSKAIRDGKFLGLVIDIENQDQLSDKRIKGWAAQLQKELLS